jgi:hypothetical protein
MKVSFVKRPSAAAAPIAAARGAVSPRRNARASASSSSEPAV